MSQTNFSDVQITDQDFESLENTGLENLYSRLRKLDELKMDFLARPDELAMNGGNLQFESNETALAHMTGSTLSLDDNAYSQLLAKLDIPKAYANRCSASIPGLLDDNVNGWLAHESEKSNGRDFLLRTYRDKDDPLSLRARAVLSSRYGLIDNYQLMKIVLEEVMNVAKETDIQVVPVKCSVTDTGSMHLRFVCPGIEMKSYAIRDYKNPQTGDDGKGGIVTGFIVKNNEVGRGMLTIAPRVVVKACQNGMIWDNSDYCMMVRHLGAELPKGIVKWSANTIQKNIEVIIAQMRDILQRYVQRDFLGKTIGEIEAAAAHQLTHPVDSILNISRHLNFSDEKTNNVLQWFSQQGSAKTGFDAIQAFTFEFQNMPSDDRFTAEAYAPYIMRNISRFDVPEKKFENPVSFKSKLLAEVE